jgi:hypothetical protein
MLTKFFFISFYSIIFFARAIHLVVSERMSHYHSQGVHVCSNDNKDLQPYKGVRRWVYRLICSDARLSSWWVQTKSNSIRSGSNNIEFLTDGVKLSLRTEGEKTWKFENQRTIPRKDRLLHLLSQISKVTRPSSRLYTPSCAADKTTIQGKK